MVLASTIVPSRTIECIGEGEFDGGEAFALGRDSGPPGGVVRRIVVGGVEVQTLSDGAAGVA